ncbi:MAG: Hsp20/alpha crystallin family protein [Candidatus Binatia bacterium]
MAEKTVAGPNAREISASREGTRAQERYVTPPVDIYETQEGLVLLADLPGVSEDDLDVQVEDNLLTIQGKAQHVALGEAVYREYELIHLFRQFELSEEVDQGRIRAELKHGVLTLHLPKAEKAKPRKIEVKVR